MGCLDENQVIQLLSGHIAEGDRRAIEAHLDTCDTCRRLVADSARAGVIRTPTTVGFQGGTLPTPYVQVTSPGGLLPLALHPGTTVGHFKIVEILGLGGMGEVYLAHDTQLGRKVALKIVRFDGPVPSRVKERFLAEARTTAGLNHPNIVTIYAVGQHDDLPYLALEYLEGETLRTRMRAGRLVADEIPQLLHSLAEALREAHTYGVVHRDLKPENIIITLSGRLKVVDFGLGLLMDNPATRASMFNDGETNTGLAGTPAYMAPEQWAQTPCGPPVDMWGFGTIAYEMLAGRRPYAGYETSVLALAEAVKTGSTTPPLPKQPGGWESDALESIVLRSLETNPRLRPTANEAVQVLSDLLVSNGSDSAIQASPRAPARSRSRSPFLIGLAVVLAVVLVIMAGAIAILVIQMGSRSTDRGSDDAPALASPSKELSPPPPPAHSSALSKNTPPPPSGPAPAKQAPAEIPAAILNEIRLGDEATQQIRPYTQIKNVGEATKAMTVPQQAYGKAMSHYRIVANARPDIYHCTMVRMGACDERLAAALQDASTSPEIMSVAPNVMPQLLVKSAKTYRDLARSHYKQAETAKVPADHCTETARKALERLGRTPEAG